MNVSNDQHLAEEAVVRALRATRANDAATGPARHAQRSDLCPSVARFAGVMDFGGTWTPAEARHVSGCTFCQKVFDMFTASAREAARDETVLGFDPSQDTQFGLNAPPTDETKPG